PGHCLATDGQAVDGNADLLFERAAHQSARGGMLDSLFGELKKRSANALVHVLIKFDIPEDPVDKGTFGPDGPTQTQRAALRADLESVTAKASEKANQLLAQVGVAAAAADARVDGPFLSVSLPAEAVSSLAFRDDVAYVGLEEGPTVAH